MKMQMQKSPNQKHRQKMNSVDVKLETRPDQGKVRKPNPFAVTFVQPSVMSYRFVNDANSAEALAQQFLAAGGCGQIVGPHGSGKTTLTYGIERALFDITGQERLVHRVNIRMGGQIALPRPAQSAFVPNQLPEESLKNQPAEGTPKKLLILDGLEQLTWVQKLLLVKNCRRTGWEMLVTTHRAVGGIDVLYFQFSHTM